MFVIAGAGAQDATREVEEIGQAWSVELADRFQGSSGGVQVVASTPKRSSSSSGYFATVPGVESIRRALLGDRGRERHPSRRFITLGVIRDTACQKLTSRSSAAAQQG
jgi:hypothetical protein